MTARDVPQGLAPLLQLLELEQPRVVTAAHIAAWTADAGVSWPVEVVVRRLRERGWLLDLKTRGVWEFAPAARAGAFGSGDPLIELRATLSRNPSAPFTVATESAVYLLGLASRRPSRESIGAPAGVRLPKGLGGLHIVRWSPTTPMVVRDGLPLWAPATLLAFMAARPCGYRDWPNVGEWIARASGQVSPEALSQELHGRTRGAWARLAYLVDCGGRPEAAQALLSYAPRGSGPYYLGKRQAQGRYDKTYDVVDSTGLEVRAE